MANIVDRFGNPIKSEALREDQTARVAMLDHEIAGHPSRGLTAAKLARILEEAERGDIRAQHELFMDMEEKDGHIFAEMSKRKRAILTLPWSVEPPDNASAEEEKTAVEVEAWMRSIPDFEDVLVDTLDAIGHAFSCQEIKWENSEQQWMPVAITHRPQTWFQINPTSPNEIRLRDGSQHGDALWSFGWITHIHRAKSGYLTRAGLHRVLAWPFLFKNYSARDLAEFLEIYGLPMRLGKYPSGSTDAEKLTLLRAVVGIGHDAAGIIPMGMEIDFKEAAKGAHDPFEFMISWCERTVSKAVLGGTLTSQADGKSSTNALGKVHENSKNDLLESDARQVASTLQRDLIYPWLALNYGVSNTRRLPKLVFDTSTPGDLSLYADALPKLVDIGLKVPVDWVHDTLHIPQPAEGEAVLGRAATPPVDTKQKQAAATRLAALRQENIDNATTPEQQLQRLMAGLSQDDLIEPIAKLVNEASSLEDLRDRILAAFADMDPQHFTRVMEQALMAASLAGRYEVGNA